MKNHVIRFAAIAGLVAAMASPANAGHSDLEFAVRFGPSYVYYDGHRHYDRNYHHSRSHKKRHHKHHHRQNNAHDRWHRHNDGRRDRYYYSDHSDMHRELRHGHR